MVKIKRGCSAPKAVSLSLIAGLEISSYLLLPILKILVPQVGQVPSVAGFLFFMTMLLGFLISFLARHFTQYPSIWFYLPFLPQQ